MKKASSCFKKVSLWLMALLVCVLLGKGAVMAAGGASVTSCVIDPANTSKVVVTVQANAGIQSDDGVLYLFAVPTYVDSVAGQTPVASVSYNGGSTYQFSVDLKNNTTGSLLYSKFVVGVKSGGNYAAITDGNFITNPELIAPSKVARTETDSKKGIHATLSIPTDLEELGIEHGFFNVSYQDFISNTPTDIAYTYNGKTYYFTATVRDYDNLISNMSRSGIAVTITLINEYCAGYEYMLHPGISQREGTVTYAVNTSTQQGVEAVAAATHFLAERYNGTNPQYGKVDNWVFGNEVNDNLMYYYMGEQNVDTFVREYLQSFRVAYTAIKSAYSNANVYICLQHRWMTADSTGDYGGRSFLDKFNAYTKAQGNIDWGLSYHPYSHPMNDPDILNDGEPSIDAYGDSTSGGEVTDSINTPLITMKNLHLLTQYLHDGGYLNPAGQVRSVILGEQGYTSYSNLYGKNESKQAANIALAYYIAEMNPDVDAFLLRTQTDENEGSQYFKFGIWSAYTNDFGVEYPDSKKYAYEMYKYIDTPASLEYTAFAKDALGLNEWGEVVQYWDVGKLAGMGSTTEDALYTVAGTSDSVDLVGTMLGQWEKGYNVYDIVLNDHSGKEYLGGVAVANGFAYYKDYQGVEKHFDTPVNLSGTPYLTFDAHFKPYDANYANDKLELQVRLHNGENIYDATGIVNVGQDYTICLDLSQWAGRSAIDTIEVLIREYGQQKSFTGTFTIYNTKASANVGGMTKLEGIPVVKTDLSDATLNYQENFPFNGNAIEPKVTVKLGTQLLKEGLDYEVIYANNKNVGEARITVVGIGNYSGHAAASFFIQGGYTTVYEGVDYGLVYAYGYYKEKYPEVVAEVGDDPDALLEHFVTKGMKYALQGTGNFNVFAYAFYNTDLEPEFGEDWKGYYMHYLEHGQFEGRTISGLMPEGVTPPEYPAGGGNTGGNGGGESGGNTGGDEGDNTGGNEGGNTGGNEGGNAGGGTEEDGGDTSQTIETTPMYRLYNPNSGEHFYTGSVEERDILTAAGWAYEGIAWNAPTNGGIPVHRLYNPNSGDHHYTMSAEERDMLVSVGWQYEGVAWNSASADNLPLYRLYNPNADCGSHHYTGSGEERDFLVSVGWIFEGIGWFGMLQ